MKVSNVSLRLFSLLALIASCLGAVPASAQISTSHTTGIFSVRDFGATGDGQTDDTKAFFKAAASAAAACGTVYVPIGNYRLSSTVTLNGCNLVGEGASSFIIFNNLPTNAPGIVFKNTIFGNIQPYIRDVFISGPTPGVLGHRTAGCEGIDIECASHLTNVRVRYFDDGIIWNSPLGHISMRDCYITDNYYGIYCYRDGSDYTIDSSNLDGNSFASIATGYDQGFDSLTIRDTHLGFSPFGIYQEGGRLSRAVVFMQDCILERARFESIGNAAIYTSDVHNGNFRAEFNSVTITYPGMSWNAQYAIPGGPRDYAVVGDLANRVNTVWNGAGGFIAPPGGSGVYNFATDASNFYIDGQLTHPLP